MIRSAYVYGFPIGHSLSPTIHNAAFGARGLPVHYEAREVAPADLAAAVEQLRAASVIGASITVPHKQAVLELVDEVDATAAEVGAVNTIQNKEGRLFGTNTDVAGFARSLERANMSVAGASVLVLGAGGAARAVTQAILRDGARRMLIANRHAERAAHLAADLHSRFRDAEVEPRSLDSLEASDMRDLDLIVNTTTVGMQADETPLPGSLLPTGALVVDIIYNPARTRLLREAEMRGLRTLNGLPMLVHQAAVAWEGWTGQPAPTDVMFSAARVALGDNG